MTKKYIDAGVAFKVLSEYYHHKTPIQHMSLSEALDGVPAADVVEVGNMEHEMAVILADLIGCPCDYGDIGETLCEVCEIIKPGSYCTSDDVACWEQYLKHREEAAHGGDRDGK